MAVLEEALEQGQKLGRDREGGQTSMFAAFDNSPASAKTMALPAVPPWSESDLLAYEKEALGFYITGHPLSRFREDIKRLSTVDTLSLQAASDGLTVRLAGLPTEVKEKVTKKGERMAFVRLEDLKGSVEMVVFPDCYTEAAAYLSGETPVLIKAVVDKDERGVKLKATTVLRLEEAARSLTSRLRLLLDAPGLTREKLVLLRQTLQRFPGSCRVSLHLKVPGKGEAVLALPSPYRVEPAPALLEEVNELFGHKVVEVVLAGD
jgi:DNA polymerase-3 subunit alpha